MTSKDPPQARPDLQLPAMLDDAQPRLTDSAIQVTDDAFISPSVEYRTPDETKVRSRDSFFCVLQGDTECALAMLAPVEAGRQKDLPD